MTIEGFESGEEMFAELERRVQANLAMIQDHQQVFQDGTKRYFMRLVDYGELLLIVGRTFDVEEHSRALAEKYPDEITYEEQLADMRENLARGFALTECFSLATPTGEVGDTHVAVMLEITQDQYLRFGEVGYDIAQAMKDPELLAPIQRWVEEVHYQ